MCSKDGKITGLRVDVIADHGAFDSTAQPTKFPAGFFHIVCGSYDLQAVARQGQGRLHEQGAGRRRLPLLVPHHRGRLPRRADGRRARAGDEASTRSTCACAASSRPSSSRTRRRPAGRTTPATTHETMRVAMDIAGYEDLRREQAEKRARGELMGIGVSFFTEGVGAGPRKHMDILGLAMNDGADLRVHPSGKAVVSLSCPDPGPGPRDDVRADRRRGARHPARGRRGPPRRHRQVAVRARHLRQPLDAGVRRARWRSSRARSATRRALIAATMLETRPEDLAWEKGRWYVKGDPEKGALDRGHRRARLQRRGAARGHGGRPRRAGHLRPAEPHLPVRRLHRGRRHRPRDGRRSRCGASSRSTTAACGSTR